MHVVTHGVKQVVVYKQNMWVHTVTHVFTVMHLAVNGVTQKARVSYLWVTKSRGCKQGLTCGCTHIMWVHAGTVKEDTF